MQQGFGRLRAAHLRLGAAGENAAERMYRNLDCDILLRDYRMPKGEIDLIVRDGFCLVFAEIKTRRAKTLERARQLKGRITPAQKRRIYRAAFTYMREIGRPHIPFRFDFVEVIYLRSRIFSMRFWPANFGIRSMKKKPQEINLFK